MIIDRTKKSKIYGQKFDKVVPKYGFYFDEIKRERVFGVKQKVDIYAEIQSHDNESDIKFIKEQLVQGAPLDINPAEYFDTTALSVDMMTAYNRTKNAIDGFYKLPAETRALYGNDPVRFANEYKTPAPVVETPAPVVETPAPVVETPAPVTE